MLYLFLFLSKYCTPQAIFSLIISNVLMIYSYGLCLAYAEYTDEDTNRNESCVKRLEQYQINWNKTKYKEDLTCGNCTR